MSEPESQHNATAPRTGASGDVASALGAGPRPAAIAFIFVTVLLDVLAMGVVIPVLPHLIKQFVGGGTDEASRYVGLFGGVWALMQFVCAPLLGALSDRVGRRPVILVSNFGLGLDYILMALAPSLWLLFVGRVISGITAASFSAAQAYIADVTTPEKRAGAYGLVGAAWGLGFILGPAVGGELGHIDPRLPFWVAAGLTLCNALYGVFILPESLPKDRRAAFNWKRANPIGSLVLLRSRRGLLGLASVVFLYWLAHHVLTSVYVLYADYRYDWGEREVGRTLALVGLCSVIVQAALVRPLVRKLGESRTLIIALVAGIAGYALYGWAPTGVMFLGAIIVFAPIGLFSPSVQGLMTRRVDPTEQGRLQGAVASISGVAGLFGPWLFTQVFAVAVHEEATWHLPGAPFYLAAALMAVALAVVVTRPGSDAGR